ncbi:MAG: hypothetical protein WA952_03145 [Lewinella sp.]
MLRGEITGWEHRGPVGVCQPTSNRVFDTTGKLLSSGQVDAAAEEINLHYLPARVYYINFGDNSGR